MQFPDQIMASLLGANSCGRIAVMLNHWVDESMNFWIDELLDLSTDRPINLSTIHRFRHPQERSRDSIDRGRIVPIAIVG